jgi:hypothetical protein
MSEDVRSDKRLLRSANTTIITIITPYISEYNWPFFLHLFFFYHRHVSLSKGFWFFLVLVRRDCRNGNPYSYTDRNPSGCYEPWTLSFLLFLSFSFEQGNYNYILRMFFGLKKIKSPKQTRRLKMTVGPIHRQNRSTT